MPFVIESLNQISENWIELTWAVLWQSTLLVGVVGGIAILLGRSSPVVRYWLWQIVAIKLLLMPFWSVAVPMPSFFDTDRETETITHNEPAISVIPVDNFQPGETDAGPTENLIAEALPATPVTPPWYGACLGDDWETAGIPTPSEQLSPLQTGGGRGTLGTDRES